MIAFLDANLLIYLNTIVTEEVRIIYESFLESLLKNYRLYTDVLVLDEVIYVSRRKYLIPYDKSIDFISNVVLKIAKILPIGEEEYVLASELIRKYKIKPSDALHIAVMIKNNIKYIISEDHEFDKVEGIKRIWM